MLSFVIGAGGVGVGGLKTLNLINIQTRKSFLKADFIFVTLDKSKGIH